MEIKLIIGVTPALENALLGLSALVSTVQPQQQVAPVSQPMPAPLAPPAQPAAIPVAPPQPTAPATLAPQQPEAPATPAPLPTASTSYSMDQLAVAATQLMDAGKRNELLQLLASFGVNALTELPKEQYGNFATQLRGLGAKI